MPAPQETWQRIEEAMRRVEETLEAIRQIPKTGGHSVTIEGIEHELAALAPRLRALRDEVADTHDPASEGVRGVMEVRGQEQRKHIFAINGSVDFLNIVRELFQEENYNVTTTNFVPNSFEQIEAVQPDALIVDVVVGDRDGWELLEQLNESAATTGIPVLVLSTSPRLLQKAREQAERYGTHRYLDKPFDLDLLLAHIREMIGQA